MKLSLLTGLTGMMLLGYGWLTMPAALSLVELQQSEQAKQGAYIRT